MTGLLNMMQYVWMTAKVISSVLNKEVVICDNDGNIIGDSLYDDLDNFSVYKTNSKSILIEAMEKKSVLRRDRIKTTSENCICCDKKDTCDINSIIAYPIISNELVLGAIGLYSHNETFLETDSEEYFFNEFLGRMSELLISKEEESRRNNILAVSESRLSNIVEHIDMAVLSLSDSNKIIHFNNKFAEMFGLSLCSDIPDTLPALFENAEFNKLLQDEHPYISTDIQYELGNQKIYTYTTVNKLYLEKGEYAGAVIYLKPMEKYLKEYDKVSNYNASIYFDDIIGSSPLLQETKKQAYKFAQNNSNILLLGESGTGKELFARAIHNASRRKDQMFITVNCAAIPDNLLESELFGYEEGAFTGAVRGGKLGKFQLAHQGTLFLDEIGEFPLHLQAKLLRALQEKKITKVGGSFEIDVDIRIIAATNRNLEQMVENGEFREDLYYRLSVAPLKIPALRQRKSDITLLTQYFVEKCSRTMEKPLEGLNREAMDFLLHYDWPGNVRELQNAIEFAANMTDDVIIEEKHLPKRVTAIKERVPDDNAVIPLKEAEQYYIEKALQLYGNSVKGKEKAAEALGIGIATLYRKLGKEKLSK